MSSEAGEGSSSSALPKKEQMDAQNKAMDLLAQGKRNLICQEVPIAVQQFQDACQILSTQFGEMARECAEAYFSYGSALLDLSRMEQDVLGGITAAFELAELLPLDVDADEEEGPNNTDQFETPENIDEDERMELRVKVVTAMSEDEINNQALIALGKKPQAEGEPGSAGVLKAVGKDVEMASAQNKPESMEAEDDENLACSSRSETSSSIEKKVAEIEIEETGDEVDGGDGLEEGMETGDGDCVHPFHPCSLHTFHIPSAQFVEGSSVSSRDTPPKEKPMEGTEEGGEEEEEGDEEESGSQEEGEEETGSQEEGQESEDSDAIPNLQLSWEFLDLAKLIYARDSSKDGQLKAADAYLKLGEVSLESEQYEQAIFDMESCLEIQKKNLEPCDRAIAETYYQLGLACQMDKQMDKAKESFTSALMGLQNKMEKLQVVVTEKPPKNPSQTVEPAESAQREIKEIMEVLPEIKEKIRETEEESKSMENLRSMAKQAMGSIFSAVADSTSETGFPGPSSSTSPSKSAEPAKTMDISHLIRKKRKPEDEKAEVVDPDKKKAKQESSSGDAGVNGVHGQVTASTSEAMAVTYKEVTLEKSRCGELL
ncbi:hypothetical protein ACOMHN_011592 [Nucella lapillus]